MSNLGHRDARAVDRTFDMPGSTRSPHVEQVHRRAADEACDEAAAREVVDAVGIVGLQDLALVHHDDLVGQRHRFVLVVRDEHGGRLQAVVQLAQLDAHQLAELGVERAQRLVHQKRLGLAHDRAAERDALAVAAGQAADARAEQVLDAQDARDLA